MTGTFELPKNGFLAVMGSLGTVLANNWWWILIGLGALLLLILLIVIIKKRKKKKEEKQAKKEAEEEKAEKKRRREEEEEEERQRRKRRREEEEEEERRRRKAQLEAQQQPTANPAAGAMAGTMAMPMAQPVIVQQPAAVQQPQPQPQPQPQAQAAPKPAEKPKILIRQSGNSGRTAELEARVKAAEERARRAEELLRKALDDRAKNAVAQTQQNNGYMQPQALNPFSQNASPYAMPFGNLYNAPSPELRAAEERAKSAEERMRSAEERIERIMQERVKAAEDRNSEERYDRLVEERVKAAEEQTRNVLKADPFTAMMQMKMMQMLKQMQTPAKREVDVELIGEMVASAVRKLSEQTGIATPHREGHKEVIPIEFKAVHTEGITETHYVPDAVTTTTTTTTVDATKKKTPVRMREIYDTDEGTFGKN